MDEEEVKRQTELAWCAGFFDGEGCTSLNSNNRKMGVSRKPTIEMNIAQAIDRHIPSEDIPIVLVRFHNAVSVGTIRKNREAAGNFRAQYRWSCSGPNCVKVFDLLKPYLSSEKIEQYNHCIGLAATPVMRTKPTDVYCTRAHLLVGANVRVGLRGKRTCIACEKISRSKRGLI